MKNSNKTVVYIPQIVGSLGVIVAGIFIILAVIFSLMSSKETIHWSFFAFCISFILAGLYMILLARHWKVVVINNEITVYPLLRRKYSFNFEDITYVRRQVKNNIAKSERVVIKTKNKKRLIVESAHVSYFKFVSRLLEKTDTEIRDGFDDYQKK